MHDSFARIRKTVIFYRTSRTHSHKALNLLAISFMGHIDLKNNENRIKRFQRGAECAVQRRIATLYQQGHSIHQISKQLSMGYGTAWNDVQRVKENNLLYI